MALAVISLQAVGYFDGLLEDPYYPLTFSWKALWEHFSWNRIPRKLLKCLYGYSGKESVRWRTIRDDEDYEAHGPNMSSYYSPLNVLELWTLFISYWNTEQLQPNSQHQEEAHLNRFVDKHVCFYNGDEEGLVNWAFGFLAGRNLIPILNLVICFILFASQSVRRVTWIGKLVRKGHAPSYR